LKRDKLLYAFPHKMWFRSGIHERRGTDAK